LKSVVFLLAAMVLLDEFKTATYFSLSNKFQVSRQSRDIKNWQSVHPKSVNIKHEKSYQSITHCNDDVMVSLQWNSKNLSW